MDLEIKTRRLVLSLEILAILIGALLILIDYKLKHDLVKLFERIEASIERGRRVYGEDSTINPDPSGIPANPLVADNPRMEASASRPESATASAKRQATVKRATPHRSGGARDTSVPTTSERVGS